VLTIPTKISSNHSQDSQLFKSWPLLSWQVRQCHTLRVAVPLCDSAVGQVRHCYTYPTVGTLGVFIPSHPLQRLPRFRSTRSTPRCSDSSSLPLFHSPLELLNFSIASLTNPWEFVLQTALESNHICSSSPRALGSCSSRWILFVTLGARLLVS
jgi:hypothetical protein